jgi:DNA-binding XRE family transcriptional regulator
MIRPTLPAHLLSVLEALAAGETLVQMTARFGITDDGVRARLVALYAVLGARDRGQAVAIGYQTGVLRAGERLVLPCVLATNVPLPGLVRARELSGVSQADMAARLGRSSTWLSLRETGRQPFPLELLIRYAGIVGFDLHAGRRLAVAA